MQLHNIASSGKKSKKRIARGGKRGTTSGRGTKGQKSRAGRRIRPAVRELILRLPKRRGYKNRPVSEKPFIISLSRISERAKVFSKDKKTVEVDGVFLKEVGIIPAGYGGEVKILGGEIDVPVSIKGIKLSGSAREKIEKAGGNIITEQHRTSTGKNKKLPRKSASPT